MLEIAMCHDVLDPGDMVPGPYACAIDAVQLQQYLSARRSWTNWNGDDLWTWLRAGSPPLTRPCYLITFDDAYVSIQTRVLPVLERFQAQALVFVATRCATGWETTEARLWRALQLGTRLDGTRWQQLPLHSESDRLLAYELIRAELKPLHPDVAEARLAPLLLQQTSVERSSYLSWPDLRRLASHPLLEFGSHTHDHAHLPTMGLREVRKQLKHSRDELQKNLGRPVRWLSYPYGAVSPSVLVQARAAGYSAAFLARPSARRRFPLARYMLPRTDIQALIEPAPVQASKPPSTVRQVPVT